MLIVPDIFGGVPVSMSKAIVWLAASTANLAVWPGVRLAERRGQGARWRPRASVVGAAEDVPGAAPVADPVAGVDDEPQPASSVAPAAAATSQERTFMSTPCHSPTQRRLLEKRYVAIQTWSPSGGPGG